MCNSFEHSYHLLNEVENFSFDEFDEVYLVEANKNPKLLKKSDLERQTRGFKSKSNSESGKDRIKRGKKAKLYKYDFHKKDAKDKFGSQYQMVSYSVKSNENTEKKNEHGGQKGYIVYNASNRNVKRVWCSCKDFFYRLWAPYAQADFSTFDLDKPYSEYVAKHKNKETGELEAHNKDWTDETNPEGTLFLCKHLYRAMTDILDMNNLARIALARDEKVTEEEQELRDQIQTDIQNQGEGGENPALAPAPTKEPPSEPVEEPVFPEDEPTPAPAPKPAPKAPVAPQKPVEKKPVVKPKKPEPSEFEKEYDKFVDDVDKEEEQELRDYEKEKKIREQKPNKVIKRKDVVDLVKDKLHGEKK